MRRALPAMSLVIFFTACQGASPLHGPSSVLPLARNHTNAGSLGPVLTTSDGGEIFGFDVDRSGNDGVLASASANQISAQTFNTTSGKITKTIGVKSGHPVAKGDDYVTDGIFAATSR